MKTFLSCIYLFFITLGTAMGQSGQEIRISGKILDAQQDPIPFANVLARYAATDSIAAMVTSDEAGNFSFSLQSQGKYTIHISYIGFADYQSEIITVNQASFHLEMQAIVLLEDAVQLDGVEVKGMRPKIVQEADKLVMDVENSALSGGSSAMEVLERAPGIMIDQEGNILLNGQSGARVMIDGRPTYLSPRELASYLRSMSSANIKNIEIITNPSAKYDAEGTAGIIDIKLKKNTIEGLNGSLHAGGGYNGLRILNGGAAINYKKGKSSGFFNYDHNESRRPRSFFLSREFPGQPIFAMNQQANLTESNISDNFRLGMDHEINEKHSVGFMLKYVDSRSPVTLNSLGELLNQEQTDLSVDSKNKVKEHLKQQSANVHYIQKLDSLGSQWSIDLDYSRMDADAFSTFDNTLLMNGTPLGDMEKLKSDNPTGYEIVSAKTDFSKMLSSGRKLEAGLKYSNVSSDNDFVFRIAQGEDWQVDPARSNHFLYKEQIFAAYTNFNTSLGSKLKLQAGLRMEHTEAEGYSITLDERPPRRYTDLFPSVFVQHVVHDDYQVNYSMSRRISRPPYALLNPFLLYADPFTAIQGNPYLLPSYTNSVEVSQVYKGAYNFTLAYQRTNNMITEAPFQDNASQFTVFRQTNLDDMQSFHARLMVPVDITDFWTTNTFGVLFYQHFDANLANFMVNNRIWTGQIQHQHQFSLPGGIRAELSATYRSAAFAGVYRINGQVWMDAGIRKSFAEDKWNLSLNFSDLFRSRGMYITTDFQNQNTVVDQYNGDQAVRISLRYNFSRGEGFQLRSRQAGNQEELQRAGG
jgi:hypothetical protein